MSGKKQIQIQKKFLEIFITNAGHMNNNKWILKNPTEFQRSEGEILQRKLKENFKKKVERNFRKILIVLDKFSILITEEFQEKC